MKDRIRTGILFAILFIANAVILFFLTVYERNGGSIPLARIYFILYAVNASYTMYCCIFKWWNNPRSLRSADLPIVIIATIPPTLMLLATEINCSFPIRIFIVGLWGLVAGLQLLTVVIRLLKYNHGWSIFDAIKREN